MIVFLNSDMSYKSYRYIHFSEVSSLQDQRHKYFGAAVASLGDLDGDGVTDIAVGSPYDKDGYETSGAIWVVLLNNDGSVKGSQEISEYTYNFSEELSEDSRLGWAIACAKDMNGDGVNDLIAGDIRCDDAYENSGAVYIMYLNNDGTMQSYKKISNKQEELPFLIEEDSYFGFSVSLLGDLDKDGVDDIIVGGG